jgi:hypothetical protein
MDLERRDKTVSWQPNPSARRWSFSRAQFDLDPDWEWAVPVPFYLFAALATKSKLARKFEENIPWTCIIPS